MIEMWKCLCLQCPNSIRPDRIWYQDFAVISGS